MAGRGDPPEGTPEGLPGGGEDEYRSVVFDESFIRAARLQEYSAAERMGDHARAVRSRPGWGAGTGSRQAFLLVLLIVLAFGTAIYMGVRHPYQPPPAQPAGPLRSTVIPLAPTGAVPGGEPDELYEQSQAAQFRTGAAGITLPAAMRTRNFSESQVMTALTIAKDYLVESSLAPDVLTGAAARPVRVLLDPDQLEQFDRSLDAPADDGRHAATGWLVRFDPAHVALADPEVRVQGTLRVHDAGPNALEVISDHTFAYALRPAGAGAGPGPDAATASGGEQHADDASLFTVRRELHFRFDRDDLRTHRAELVFSYVQAGPMACSADPSGALQPLLAGERATAEGPAGTDPYETHRAAAALCGTLAPDAQPSP
ncbi:SCO2583 family membrane protein [Streptomyces sp. NPDC001514]